MVHSLSDLQEGDTVMLRINVYIWNSLRGYMYQFFSTDQRSLLHVIGNNDVMFSDS